MEKEFLRIMDELLQKVDKIDEKVSRIEPPKNEVKWLDVSETCRFLKVSPRTLQNYRDKGLLPYSQINAKIYFREQDLLKFLESHLVNNSKF